jgi:hypothetical protein
MDKFRDGQTDPEMRKHLAVLQAVDQLWDSNIYDL